MVQESMKNAEACQKVCLKLDKMAKGKVSCSEAGKLLQVAYKALTDLKGTKARLFKALKND